MIVHKNRNDRVHKISGKRMVYGGDTQLTAGFTGDAKDLFRRMRPDSGHEGKDYLSSKVILMTASQTQTM